ncbi:MAG TPA: glyoxylate/hydroxypyruvate reductase A [Burkholderiaceae bacterium]|nr:glyoxylate/hydroxypyruvate reductase A [Burkholderiaceae bacterium]
MSIATPLRIALATGPLEAAPWRAALQEQLAAAGIDAEVHVWDGAAIGADYAVAWLPPPALFALEPKLRAVFNLGAGVDALLARVPESVPIIRLVDAGMAPKIAEYVCFALARITRGLDRFAPHPRGSRDWNAPRPRGGAPTVAVAGLGAIGAAVAQAVLRFGYPAIGWSRTPKALPGVECFSGAAGLAPFLARAQVLVNALPLTPATENLFDAAAFAQMPRGAHLINVGRGATIVDADLLAALDSGQLASATLDVFRVEPLPPDHPFWTHPAVTVTPHLSGPTPRAPAAQQIAHTLRQLLDGVPAHAVAGYVDRARGY